MLKKLVLTAGLAAATGCSSVPVAAPATHTTLSASPVIPAANPPAAGAGVAAVKTDAAVVTVAATQTEPLPDRLPTAAGPPVASAVVVQPATALTLAAVEELACTNNPTLVQARAQVDGTLGKALQAGLWPNPVLGYQADKIGSQGTAGEFQGGFIRQEIVTAQKRRISREKYLARAEAAEFVALAQQFRVKNDIRRMYWRAAGAARQVTIREQMVKNAEDRLVTTEEMFNVGQANAVQVRQARVGLQRAKLDLRAAVNDRDQSRRELSALVGADLPPGPLEDPLDGPVGPLTWEASLAYTLAESPELREATAKLRGDRITVDRERRQPIPNVFVQAGPGYDYTEKRTVVNAQAYIALPVWDRNQGTIQQAQADLARQQAELRRVELRLGRDLATHFKQYQTALQHVEAYRAEVLPEAEKAYQGRLDAYKQRRETWPNVLDAQADLYMRQAEYVRNLVAWRESQTLIEGFLLTGGLDAPPNPTPPGHIDATPQPR
ncbi:MAG: TolC family protein [Gemmataceae bacterium]